MQEYLANYLNLGSKLIIALVLITTPFLFWNLTTEFYDTPKFLVLLIVTAVLLVVLAVKFVLNGKVVLIRTPLDIPLLLLASVAIVSTVLSSSPYVALLGNQLKIHGSLVSAVVYILFYFVLVNNLKTFKEVKGLLFIITFAAGILSVTSLLAYAGVKLLPAPWSHGINFTLTGSSFSTTALLALLIPFVVSQIINSSKTPNLILNSVFLTLFGVTIALTGSLATWIAALFGLGLTVLASPLRKIRHISQISPINLISLIVPVAAVVLVSILSFIPPLGTAKNPLYSQTKSFPREIQLPFITSWKISVSSFRDSPFWGSGPGTYSFNFTNYKPIEHNFTKNWNLRFDSAFNEYLSVLATLGGIGLVALLSLTALFLSSAYAAYMTYETDKSDRSEFSLLLAISGLLFFILLALHTSTLVLWVFGVIILASFMAVASKGQTLTTATSNIKDTLLAIAGNVRSGGASTQTLKIEALPSMLLITSVTIVLFAFFFAGKFLLADNHHRKALNAVAQNQGIAAYNELIMAEKLNPYNDLYRTDLAQTNFALANAIASAKGPTEASPSGSLNDQDKQNIQVLLQQSINEGRAATILSPKSALNWEILGLLYRQIAGVAQNALVFSLDSYGKAIFQDPLNPNLRLSVGGVYYTIQNYDLAIRFFTDAINLKPDFANAYYNLSVALKDKGDLNNAQAAAEKVLTLVEADSQDYKIVSEYLTNLKTSSAAPPASETSGALQQKELPKVVDVGKPPQKIATPAAVAKPSPTPNP